MFEQGLSISGIWILKPKCKHGKRMIQRPNGDLVCKRNAAGGRV